MVHAENERQARARIGRATGSEPSLDARSRREPRQVRVSRGFDIWPGFPVKVPENASAKADPTETFSEQVLRRTLPLPQAS